MSFIQYYLVAVVFCTCRINGKAISASTLTKLTGSENGFVNAIAQQNFQTILSSIEDRLRNLDAVYKMQYSTTIEGKLNRFVRKLEMIEMKIERLEMKLESDVEKIIANVSNKNYVEDLRKELTFRKINDIHDRLNQKLTYFELKIDINQKKTEDKFNYVNKQLDRYNDNLLTGLMDTESELGDVLAGIDEINASNGEIVRNLTLKKGIFDKIEASHDLLVKSFGDLNATANDNKLFEYLKSFAKQNERSHENLNHYFNKITNMYEEMWNRSISMAKLMKIIDNTLNETRHEQQNNMRSLLVQTGRKYDKNITNRVSETDVQRINEISKKMDENFENLIATQNMFLESCYRVQMDESFTFEPKITLILQKLIDTIEKKTTCQRSDLQKIEEMLKNHDGGIKLNLINAVSLINGLLKNSKDLLKTIEHNFPIISNFIESKTKSLRKLFLDIATNDTRITSDEFKNIKQDLNRLKHIIQETLRQTALDDLKKIGNIDKQEDLFGLEKNEDLTKNVTNLDEIIQEIFNNETTTHKTTATETSLTTPTTFRLEKQSVSPDQDLDQLIANVFGNLTQD